MYYEGLRHNGMYYTGSASVILSHRENSNQSDDDSYYFEIPLEFMTTDDHYAAAVWCEENCTNKWLVGCDHSAFINEEDAFMFKMRWI